jgi:hypothetical protein
MTQSAYLILFASMICSSVAQETSSGLSSPSAKEAVLAVGGFLLLGAAIIVYERGSHKKIYVEFECFESGKNIVDIDFNFLKRASFPSQE